MSSGDRAPASLPRSDRRFAAFLLVFLAGYYVVFCGYYYANTEGIFDHTGNLIGRDFVVYWTASIAVLQGQALVPFDVLGFHELQQQVLGSELPLHPWPYPPVALFVVLPFGLLPYLWGYALWTGGSLLLYLLAAVGRQWRSLTTLALVLAPATFANFMTGQNGYLSAALLIGGMRLLDRRPVMAGVVIGLLSYKPQLGLLIPVALVAGRQWRAFCSAAVTVVALYGLSAAVFGLEAWEAFFTGSAPAQTRIMHYGEGLFMSMMPTPFIAARVLGLDLSVGYAFQAVFTLGAIAGVYLAFRRTAERRLQIAALLVAAVLASPYAFNYDMTVVSVAVLWALAEASRTGFLPGEKLVLTLAWVLPIAVVGLNHFGLPLGPVILTAFLALLLARIHGRHPAVAGTGAGMELGSLTRPPA